MELKKGLYEHVLNREINQLINENAEDIDVIKEIIGYVDADLVLATYLSKVLRKGLNYYRSSDKGVMKQVKIANEIISHFAELIEDEGFKDYTIPEKVVLKGIFNKEQANKRVRPSSSVAYSFLFTGNTNIYNELKKEILSADRVDLLVSFIKFTGLRLLMDSLIEHTKTKKLRVLTTSYMSATDYRAIEDLARLPNTEIRISYDTKRTRLHAKAYYFHRETGFSTAYIGSSNISYSALTAGTEWNMKVSEYTSPDVIEKIRAAFASYWNSNDFVAFNINKRKDRNRLKLSLKSNGKAPAQTVLFNIRPYAYQQEILDGLEVERKVYGSRKNLIVAATGTGKTVISAFDFKRYYKEHSNCRLLFLAHREEILKQSIATFRQVLRNQNFGDLWVGEFNAPSSYEHLFASIQTLNSNSNYERFPKDYFNFIILDETHHGVADSYARLLNYFEPDVLVGLTATPERMDGEDILVFFNNRIAYEMRLHEAIDRGLLCPFHYFGVTDNVDLDSVKWVRGRYDVSELNNLYTGNHARAVLIIRSIKKYTADIESIKGLGFCVSKKHAESMSDFFNQKGIPSINLDSDSPQAKRNAAKSRLLRGEIKFIFVVDLYNEGVDIPEVNTVLFLRPTESATIFIQQLGRGLRISEGKEVLTVLDFVGQANKEFNFRTKFRSIIGRSNLSIKEEIEHDFPKLPRGCFIHLERKAKDYILNGLKRTYVNKHRLIQMLRDYHYNSTKPLTLATYLTHYQLEKAEIYKNHRFYELCKDASLTKTYLARDYDTLKNCFKRVMHINSLQWINFLLEYLMQKNYSLNGLTKDERLMLLMFHYTIWDQSPDGDLVYYLNKLRYDNPSIFKEIMELLQYNKNSIDFIEKDINLGYDCPLKLYAAYSIIQILAAFEYHTEERKRSFREGVLYLEDKNTDLFFVTLNKEDKSFTPTTQYEDYAISDRLFHWQSQSRTSDTSATGQRYINQRKQGNNILIFVREYRKENSITSPYHFLGKANYRSHSGSKPISIIWEMEKPIPTFILKKSRKIWM